MRIATEPTHALYRDRQVQKSVLVLRDEKRDAMLGYDNFCADAVVIERHADDTLTVLFLESSHKWVCGAEILQTTERGLDARLVQHLVDNGAWARFCTVVAIHPRVDRRALAVHLDSCQQEMEDLCDAFKALDFTRGLFRCAIAGHDVGFNSHDSKLARVARRQAWINAWRRWLETFVCCFRQGIQCYFQLGYSMLFAARVLEFAIKRLGY